MPKFYKVFKLILIFLFVMVLTVPITSVIANADYDDTLYIVIEMSDTFEYSTSAPVPTSIKYYSDEEKNNEVFIDGGDITIEYFDASDLVNPLIGAPKDAGSYEIRVTYHDEVIAPDVPDYNYAEKTHSYDITKATISITASAFTRPYFTTEQPYEYEFDSFSQGILLAEFPTLSYDDMKIELFSGELSREEGQDVGVYDILIGSLALKTPHSNNYNLTFTSNTYTITQAPLTIINIGVDNKIYDATDAGIILTSGTDYVIGRVEGDDIEDVYLDITNAIATFNDINVANGIDVIFSGYQLLGDRAFNYYVVVPDPYTANITRRVLNISAIEVTTTYDPDHIDDTLDYNINAEDLSVLETEFLTTDLATVKGNFNGVLIRIAGNNADTYVINQGTLAISNVGNFNTTNYIINYTSANYNINPFQLDIIIDTNLSKIYGETDPVILYTLSELTPLFSGDTLTGALSREAGNNIGTYDILTGTLTISGSLASNYSINIIDYEDAFTINSRLITITADDKSSIYGSALVPLTYTIVEGSLATGDNITGSLLKAVGLVAGEYSIIQDTLNITNISNYTLTFNDGLYIIEKIELDMSVDPLATLSKSYGDPDPVMDFVLSVGTPIISGHSIGGSLGRVDGELFGFYSLNTSRIVILDASNADVTVNYSINLDDSISGGGTYLFEIYRDEIFIDPNMPLSSPYKVASYEAAPMFYDNSELTVIVLISQADYEIYYYNREGTTPLLSTPNVPGLYTVTVEFYGTLNYLPKIESFDYEITKAILTISGISIQNKIYDTTANGVILGTPVLTGVIYDPSSLSLITTGAVATFDDRNVSINSGVVINKNVTVSGYTLTGAHSAYYEIAQPIMLTAKISHVNLDITAQDVTREYNPLLPEGTLNYNINSALSLLAIEFGSSNITVIKSNFIGALHRTPGSSVNVYSINIGTLALPVAIADNYNVRFTSGTYRITPINFTATVIAGQTKVYGEADPASILFAYDLSVLLPGDVLVGALVRVAGQNAGNYNISLGTLTVKNMYGTGVDVGDTGLGNYKVTLISNPFIITKRPITIRANNTQPIKFGEQSQPLTYNIQGGLVYGDTAIGSIIRVSGNNAGTYEIRQGTLSVTNASNYSITFINGVYTIQPKNIMLSVDPATKISKTYGETDPVIAFILNSATPLISGHIIGGSLGRAPGENADFYPLNASKVIIFDENGANVTSNYAFILDTSNPLLLNFTINKRILNVTAKNITVYTDRMGYTLKLEFSGFVNGETKDDLDVVYNASVSNLVEGINNINVTATPKGSGTSTQDKNYSLVTKPGKLTLINNDNVPKADALGNESKEFKQNNVKFKGFTYYNGAEIYDINTMSGNQPTNEIIVSLELPEKLADAKRVGILLITSEGVTVIPCTIVEGQVEFIMKETGLYLIAKPVNGFLIIVLPILGLIGIGVGVYMFLMYIKKNSVKKYKPSKQSRKAKKLGAGATDENGLKKDFSDSGFDTLIDTGEGVSEGSGYDDYDNKKEDLTPILSKRDSKRKSKLDKQSSEIVIMDDIDAAMDKPVTMDELIVKPKNNEELKPNATQNDNLLEEDFLSKLDKKSVKKEYVIPEEKIVEPEPEIIIPKKNINNDNNDLNDILEELLKAEPKPNKDAVSSSIFGNMSNEFSELASTGASQSDSDEDDDIVAPAYKKDKLKTKAKEKADMSSFGTLDEVEVDMNDLSPMIKKKAINEKVSMNKVVPNANAPKKPIEKKVSIKEEFGNIDDLVDKDLNKEYSKSTSKNSDEGKIIKQGGARRFDD